MANLKVRPQVGNPVVTQPRDVASEDLTVVGSIPTGRRSRSRSLWTFAGLGVTVLCVTAGAIWGTRSGATPPKAVPRVNGASVVAMMVIPESTPGPVVLLNYVGMSYFNGGPADPVIELKVILDNQGDRHSDSSSIRWEPEFAREFTFLKSSPPAWRVRIDEWGWGVFDGDGVRPHGDGTYLIWFTTTGYKVREPRIQVVANGNMFVDDTFAIAMNRILTREPELQGVFERQPIAGIIDRIGRFVPDAAETSPFEFAVAFAATLSGLTLAGTVFALRRTPDSRTR